MAVGCSTKSAISPSEAAIWCAAAVTLIAASLGCSKAAGSRGNGLESSQVNEVFRSFIPPPPSSEASSDLDVYVDGSKSMRGYASSPDSNYNRLLRGLLQSATAGSFNLSVFKFTSTITPITNIPLNQIQSPGFYDGQDTPLRTLMARVAAAPTHTAIIVSDMVQSEVVNDNLAFTKALVQLASRSPQMRLLAYRSSFAREYYPESHRGQASICLSITQSLPCHRS